MGNANNNVKEAADYVTTDVENDGIYNALKELNQAISNATTSRIKLKEFQDKCRTAYLDYNDTLNIAIQEAERR